jgi:oligoribonuclease
MSTAMNTERLIWLDLETFGLDPIQHPILEIGLRITDLELKTIDDYHDIIWIQNNYERRRKAADTYVQKMHETSGLWKEAETVGSHPEIVAEHVLDWLDKHDANIGDPVCGSSVQFDRAMLAAQMPDINNMFSYRNIDISTLKELCARYNPRVYSKLDESTHPRKAHRVMPDLADTINEARFYFDNFLWLETYE